MSAAPLPKCHICNNQLKFHQEDDICDGCHNVWCDKCEYLIDFYGQDTNMDTLKETKEVIAKKL